VVRGASEGSRISQINHYLFTNSRAKPTLSILTITLISISYEPMINPVVDKTESTASKFDLLEIAY